MIDIIGATRRFHRDHTNRWIRRLRPDYADHLVHRGRRSGISYETPVVVHLERGAPHSPEPPVQATPVLCAPVTDPDRSPQALARHSVGRRVLIVATYGLGTDWVANVLAAGEATLRSARIPSQPSPNDGVSAETHPLRTERWLLMAPRVLSRAEAMTRLSWGPRWFLRMNRRAVVLAGYASPMPSRPGAAGV